MRKSTLALALMMALISIHAGAQTETVAQYLEQVKALQGRANTVATRKSSGGSFK